MLAFSKPILEKMAELVGRLFNNVQRVPIYFWIYLAVVGYVYKRMMRDFLGIGTKRCQIIGKVSLHLSKEEEILSASVVDPSSLSDSFATVGGLDEVKAALTESVVWPYQHPELLEAAGAGSALPTGVLLYGPPGTGKTLLARALAKELGCFFIEVSVEKLFSKYVGESEKLAAAVFSLAHKLKNCVIFVDEIDSLLSSRAASDSDSSAVYMHAKTIFMTKWDGLQSAAAEAANRGHGDGVNRVLVLGATNRADALDDAILRRLSVRLQVPLPCAASRQQIFAIQLQRVNAVLLEDTEAEAAIKRGPDTFASLATNNTVLARIAHDARHYTGSDIRELCKAALMISFRGKVQALRLAAQNANEGNATGGGSNTSSLSSGVVGTSSSASGMARLLPSDFGGGSGTATPPSPQNVANKRPTIIRESDMRQAMQRVRPSGVEALRVTHDNTAAMDPIHRFFQRAAADMNQQARKHVNGDGSR